MITKKATKTVYLSQLKHLQILWPGDVHMFAEFLLRSSDAKDAVVREETGRIQISRPTLHGIASHLSRLMDVSESRIENEFTKHKLSCGAVVEFD